MVLEIRVNGETHTVEVSAGMPLLWVLRDVLGLTGTKFGCGQGDCGACTVLVDGRPRRSCITPVESVVGREILTIEGLAGREMHRVQKAWLDEQVVQCGACQPGMILGAVALLQEHPHPTDEQIDRALAHHLCRCGTYQRVRRAIHRAADEGER